MACAQCHDHKYDPITMQDYYGMMDAFNQVSESGRPGRQSTRVQLASPFIEIPTEENKVKIKEFEIGLLSYENRLRATMTKTKEVSSFPKRKGPTQAQFVRVINDTPRDFSTSLKYKFSTTTKTLPEKAKRPKAVIIRMDPQKMPSMETPLETFPKIQSPILRKKPSHGWRSTWDRKSPSTGSNFSTVPITESEIAKELLGSRL